MAIAFFDIDETIIDKGSGRLFFSYLHRKGRISRAKLTKVLFYYVVYKLHFIDMNATIRRTGADLRGRSEQELIEECNLWFEEVVRDHIFAEAEEAVRSHQAAGDKVVLITAATKYISAPLAGHLAVDAYLCTRFEVAFDGTFTGSLIEPSCYGEGKLTWARQFCQEHGEKIEEAAFYSDSISDRPLMEKVGRPIAVNPDPRLRRLAQRRGWPIQIFHRTRARQSSKVRSRR